MWTVQQSELLLGWGTLYFRVLHLVVVYRLLIFSMGFRLLAVRLLWGPKQFSTQIC